MARKIAETPILTDMDAKDFIKKIKSNEETPAENLKKLSREKSKKDYSVILRDHAVNTSKLKFPDLNFMYDGLTKSRSIFPPIDDTVKFTLTGTTAVSAEPFRTFSMDEIIERWEKQRIKDSKFPRNIYVYLRRKFLGIYHKIKDFPREIKYFVQRGRRGYSDRDIWSYDYFLADIIGNGLKQLADTTKLLKSGRPNYTE